MVCSFLKVLFCIQVLRFYFYVFWRGGKTFSLRLLNSDCKLCYFVHALKGNSVLGYISYLKILVSPFISCKKMHVLLCVSDETLL